MKALLFQTFIIFLGLSSSVYCQNSTFIDIKHYKQEIKHCYDTKSPLNSSTELIEYGISVEKCLKKIGYEVTSKYYSHTPQLYSNFEKLIKDTNTAYLNAILSDKCLPNCGSSISYGYFSGATDFIETYLQNLLLLATK
ncbi:MAG: hypothetical protein E7012_06140 [Alphaproteobacteria bacterium]|nr:hypothetical protein [Alphaproteobacteria bacterium]